MSQCSKYSKIRKFLSLLVNGFPFVREYRVRRKIRYKKLKMQKLIKEDPLNLKFKLIYN